VNDKVNVRFGVDNLFNRRPEIIGRNLNANPDIGQLTGGGYSFFQDQQGRRFTLGTNIKF
jgi:outer membrane receptor protein involved in Fe transport